MFGFHCAERVRSAAVQGGSPYSCVHLGGGGWQAGQITDRRGPMSRARSNEIEQEVHYGRQLARSHNLGDRLACLRMELEQPLCWRFVLGAIRQFRCMGVVCVSGLQMQQRA